MVEICAHKKHPVQIRQHAFTISSQSQIQFI